MNCQRSQGLESEGHTSQRTTWNMYIVVNSKELNIPFLPPYLFFMTKFQPHCASFIRMPSLPSSSHKRNYLAQVSITAFSFMLKRTMHLGLCLCKFFSSTMLFLTLLLLLEDIWHHHNLLCWCSGHIVAFLVTRNSLLHQQPPVFGRVGGCTLISSFSIILRVAEWIVQVHTSREGQTWYFSPYLHFSKLGSLLTTW